MSEFTDEQIKKTVGQHYQSVTARKLTQVYKELETLKRENKELTEKIIEIDGLLKERGI